MGVFFSVLASPTVHTCGRLSVVENHCPLRMQALRPFLYLKNIFIFITAIAFLIVDRPITLKNKTSCLCLVAHLSPPSMVHCLSSSLSFFRSSLSRYGNTPPNFHFFNMYRHNSPLLTQYHHQLPTSAPVH